MMIKNLDTLNSTLKSYSSDKWISKTNNKISNRLPNLNSINDTNQSIDNKSFVSFLKDSLLKVNKLQEDANVEIQKLTSGNTNNLQETLLAIEKADLAFKTMNQIRMKVIDAYREVMKIQL